MNKIVIATTGALALGMLVSLPRLSAQGPLTPPGAPAPTMKTLDQIEPRTPLGPSTSQVTINAPGSYYLAGDIAVTGNGISITSGNVTLDLNGFSIRKVSGTGSAAIAIDGAADNAVRNVTIRNGHLSGAFGTGISITRAHNLTIEDVAIEGAQSTGISSTSASALRPSNVTIRRCRLLGAPVDAVANAPLSGMSAGGISVQFAMACVVEDCVVSGIAGSGIRMLTANSGDVTSSGIVRGCVISRCGQSGISLNVNGPVPQGLLVERCTVDQCGVDGIIVACPARIVDCISNRNGGNGIAATLRSAHITGCHTELNGGDGIRVGSDSLVKDCVADSNGTADGAGIHVTGTGNVIRENVVTDNDRGLDVDLSLSLIIKNSASGNTFNFDIVANNKVGVILVPPNSAAINGSTGGAGVGTTDPWANFSY